MLVYTIAGFVFQVVPVNNKPFATMVGLTDEILNDIL